MKRKQFDLIKKKVPSRLKSSLGQKGSSSIRKSSTSLPLDSIRFDSASIQWWAQLKEATFASEDDTYVNVRENHFLSRRAWREAVARRKKSWPSSTLCFPNKETYIMRWQGIDRALPGDSRELSDSRGFKGFGRPARCWLLKSALKACWAANRVYRPFDQVSIVQTELSKPLFFVHPTHPVVVAEKKTFCH